MADSKSMTTFMFSHVIHKIVFSQTEKYFISKKYFPLSKKSHEHHTKLDRESCHLLNMAKRSRYKKTSKMDITLTQYITYKTTNYMHCFSSSVCQITLTFSIKIITEKKTAEKSC